MSTDGLQCCLPNYDCENCIPLKFNEKYICKCCDYDTDLHTDSAVFTDDSVFTKPDPAPTSQHSVGTTESNAKNTTQGTHPLLMIKKSTYDAW